VVHHRPLGYQELLLVEQPGEPIVDDNPFEAWISRARSRGDQ
jgi:hypothetical protein